MIKNIELFTKKIIQIVSFLLYMKTILFLLILSITLILSSGCVEDTSVDSLISYLDNENESIRTASIDKLAEIGDEKTVASLNQMVKDDNRTIEERKNAITVLGMIGGNSTAEMLLNISLDEEEEKYLRMASILALGEIGDDTMIKPLKEVGYGDDGLILYHAAYVLDPMEDKEDVYATYGKLPYPLSEDQRLYRNNVGEIRGTYRADGTFPEIENATSILIGYNVKTGYIEISSDVEPEPSVMDEIYQIYDTEARKRAIYQVPVRFVRCGSAAPLEGYWYNISDIAEFNITNISF
ncbi:HEAT repeat domain-containing protein [Methanolobus sp. ZRKC5]|uniref:HEAT repeat domain-containing protein n=1 Tax=Methanolobus sp. ZRKC5 TaxID=3136295 RepID=UPI00313BA0A8